MDYSCSGDDTDQYCKDCRRITQTVLDHRQGDTICSECGLVLEAYFVDTTAEWRTFADSENDPVRVGHAENPLLSDGGLVTMISDPKNNENSNQARSLGRLNNIVEKPDRSLENAFKTIGKKADRLAITKPVVYRAQQIYKEAYDKKLCRKKEDALTSACLYLANKKKPRPRTLKEIGTVTGGENMKKNNLKEINKCFLVLKRELKIDSKAIVAEDLLPRRCYGMTPAETKAVYEIVKNVQELLDIRRNPRTLMAGALYLVVQLSDDEKRDDEKSIKLVQGASERADVAVATTRKAYRDLYPYAHKIIPSWFAKPEDVKKLPKP